MKQRKGLRQKRQDRSDRAEPRYGCPGPLEGKSQRQKKGLCRKKAKTHALGNNGEAQACSRESVGTPGPLP